MTNKRHFRILKASLLLLLAGLLAQACSQKSQNDQPAAKSSSGKPQHLTHDTQPTFRPYRPVNATGLTSLGITVLEAGRGPLVKEGSWVQAQYTGTLKNGTVFDRTTGQAASFKLEKNQVIEGWVAGLVGQRQGCKLKLAIPAAMAYGSKSQGKVPANSDLYFEIEIVKVF